MQESWNKLQNGTDIRGIAISTAQRTANLTEAVVKTIGYAFTLWLTSEKKVSKTNCKIAVGMDSRLSGPGLKQALIAGLTAGGCTVYDCGMATTPAMFMATIMEDYQCDGAIMLTASHLPSEHNGLKLFTKEGGCEKEDISSLLQLAATLNSVPEGMSAKVVQRQLIDDYSQVLIDMIRQGVGSGVNYAQPLLGSKIIVDAGNGAGGFFAHKVLSALGADTAGSQFLEPDGHFPNHIPNPENKIAMEAIKTAVKQHQADLGIIFDADVDRAAVVSADGDEINRNALVALMSAIILKEHPGSTIVTDSITSTGLTAFIEELGGKHHRFKRGYKNVINESKRLNQEGQPSYLAIETSGHAACRDNYFLDDGAYLVAKILITAAMLKAEHKDIHHLISTLKRPQAEAEFRFKIMTEDFKKAGLLLLQDVEDAIKAEAGWSLVPNNYEGIRVNVSDPHGNGWFLLRLSLHEPLLVLNMESDAADGVGKIAKNLRRLLEKYQVLCAEDVAKLN